MLVLIQIWILIFILVPDNNQHPDAPPPRLLIIQPIYDPIFDQSFDQNFDPIYDPISDNQH